MWFTAGERDGFEYALENWCVCQLNESHPLGAALYTYGAHSLVGFTHQDFKAEP